jgi:uncharacterized membrane protein YcaP (DUF421 family)
MPRSAFAAGSTTKPDPFNLILLVVLGDLIQQAVTQNDFSVVGGMSFPKNARV